MAMALAYLAPGTARHVLEGCARSTLSLSRALRAARSARIVPKDPNGRRLGRVNHWRFLLDQSADGGDSSRGQALLWHAQPGWKCEALDRRCGRAPTLPGLRRLGLPQTALRRSLPAWFSRCRQWNEPPLRVYCAPRLLPAAVAYRHGPSGRSILVPVENALPVQRWLRRPTSTLEDRGSACDVQLRHARPGP
jgi:hypothetical protein